MISMSDHFYNDELLLKIKNSDLLNTLVNVGADYKTNVIHDPDDAMKLIIEKDSNLVNLLNGKFSDKINILNKDILKFDLNTSLLYCVLPGKNNFG